MKKNDVLRVENTSKESFIIDCKGFRNKVMAVYSIIFRSGLRFVPESVGYTRSLIKAINEAQKKEKEVNK